MIRIFDLALNLLGEIDDYESLIFTRDYYTHGTFEIHINANKNNTEYLVKNNIIIVDRALNKCGIIKISERTAEESEQVMVQGFTLDYLFSKRVILPASPSAFDSITGPAETAIKHYIENCITNPLDPDRKMNIFNLTTDQARGNTSEYNARGENLSEYLSSIRTEHQMGIETKLNLQSKKIDIDVLIGKDHRTGTAEPVIFSTDYDNLLSQNFYESDVEEKNFAYIFGQGEGNTRETATYGTETGIERKEMIVEANVPLESLESVGETELAQYPPIMTFEAEVINRLPFVYEQDFDLGDQVTVTNKKWGVQLNTRIVQITEIYEADSTRIEVAFGNNIPTLKDVVNRKTKKEVK